MTDSHRPFAPTCEAAQEAQAEPVGETIAPHRAFKAAQQAQAEPVGEMLAPRRRFARTAAVLPETQPHVAPDAYEAMGTFAVNRPERRTMPRRRLPLLLTAGVVVALSGQVVWWAYQEVDGEQPVTTVASVTTVVGEAPPLTEVTFEPPLVDPPGSVANIWPPIPQQRPTDGWATTVGGPPRPVFKPR